MKMKMFNYSLKTYLLMLLFGLTIFLILEISGQLYPDFYRIQGAMWFIFFIFAMFAFQTKCSRIVHAHNMQVIDQRYENHKKERENILKKHESKILIKQILETPYYKNSRSKFAKELKRRMREE